MMKKLIISLLFVLGCFTSAAFAETPAIFANISNTDGVSVMTDADMSNVSAMGQYELNYYYNKTNPLDKRAWRLTSRGGQYVTYDVTGTLAVGSTISEQFDLSKVNYILDNQLDGKDKGRVRWGNSTGIFQNGFINSKSRLY